MTQSSASSASDLSGILPARVQEEYARRGLADWSDGQIAAAVARILSVPKRAWTSSFVLHAPLEFLARIGLLSQVRPGARAGVRQRLVQIAARYAAEGERIERPAEPIASVAPEQAAGALVGAIGRGDQAAVDRHAIALARTATPLDLRRLLADAVLPFLTAAGHAPILLYLLPRVAAGGMVGAEIIRPSLRELASDPRARLTWYEQPAADGAAEGNRDLSAILLELPGVGPKQGSSIAGILGQIEGSPEIGRLREGIGAAGLDLRTARQQLLRVAAWSMLQEPPAHAPYGWSHCLTLPQAVLGIVRPGPQARAAVAVAATYVAGFRYALGSRRLVPGYAPERPASLDLDAAITASPELAAATAWHAAAAGPEAVAVELATRAALHHDAHLAKYTLACLDAGAEDPDQERLYLAAAAYLSAWWAQQPQDGFLTGS